MNRDRFDHSLSGWLADQSSTPTYLDEAMARTRATRQRPAWSFPERWLPMQLTIRRAYVPRSLFYLALVALLTIAVTAAALAIGAARQVAPPFGPARNGLLAFDQSGSIVVARPGSAAAPVVLATVPGAVGPVFAPDGTRFAFYAQKDGVDTLFVARPDGSEPVAVSQGRLLGGTDLEMRPSWSPDSRRIAFTGFTDGAHHLYVANITESSSIELGAAGQSRIDPAWSPDGDWIAFQAPGDNKISQQGLYLIRPDGTDEHLVASAVGGPFAYRHPQWLPDPDRQVLAYPIGTPGAYDIATFDVASNTETVVSREPAAELWPVWSPDGMSLAWNASDMVVRIARPDGTVVNRIPAAIDYDFVWSPDGTALYGWKDEQRTAAVIVTVDGSSPTVEIPVAGRSRSSFSWQRLAP